MMFLYWAEWEIIYYIWRMLLAVIVNKFSIHLYTQAVVLWYARIIIFFVIINTKFIETVSVIRISEQLMYSTKKIFLRVERETRNILEYACIFVFTFHNSLNTCKYRWTLYLNYCDMFVLSGWSAWSAMNSSRRSGTENTMPITTHAAHHLSSSSSSPSWRWVDRVILPRNEHGMRRIMRVHTICFLLFDPRALGRD